MEEKFIVCPIAHIHNDFHDKFGIPRQSGLVPDLESTIIFEKAYRHPDALRGIENFSHLWLLWHFTTDDSAEFHPTVRPPRLGGNKRIGVFASRSPYRPNSIGLSSVRLKKVEKTEKNGTVLIVTGADLLSGTPILDIKPSLRYTDSPPPAVSSFADEYETYRLTVHCPPSLLERVPSNLQGNLLHVLEQDPRPSYQKDEKRIYAMDFADYRIQFKVVEKTLTVTDIAPLNQ